jgi:hypothetical protein
MSHKEKMAEFIEESEQFEQLFNMELSELYIDVESNNLASKENDGKTEKVSQEVIERLDPEWYGRFRYEKWELENGENAVLNWGPEWLAESWDRRGSLCEKLEKVLLKYNGEGIKPEMINAMISDLCDCEYVATSYDGTKVKYKLGDVLDYTMLWWDDSLVWYTLAYVDYLQPKTVNKIMDNSRTVSIRCCRWGEYWTFAQLKKFYEKLDNNHKAMYYDKLFNGGGRVDFTGQWLTEQYMLDDLWDYIFEKPLSSNTYNMLKDFLSNVNKDWNWIKKSETSSKKTIDQLKDKGQITETQAKELYGVSWIKYEK